MISPNVAKTIEAGNLWEQQKNTGYSSDIVQALWKDYCELYKNLSSDEQKEFYKFHMENFGK